MSLFTQLKTGSHFVHCYACQFLRIAGWAQFDAATHAVNLVGALTAPMIMRVCSQQSLERCILNRAMFLFTLQANVAGEQISQVPQGWCIHAGFGLVNYKLTSTWAEHCPAYYLAISLEEKQVMIAIRGTAQIEDVITDLTALPTVCVPAQQVLTSPPW